MACRCCSSSLFGEQALRRCQLACMATASHTLRCGSVLAFPVVQVGEGTALAELQRQFDAAFALLRVAKRRDDSLFRVKEGGQL